MQQLTITPSTEERRTFQSVQPSGEAVLRAVDAASQTEIPKTHEPWYFYLVGPESIESIAWLKARCVEREKGGAAARKTFEEWRQVPGWMVVTCEQSNNPEIFEESYALCSNAVQNFVLSLWSEHIDTSWITESIVEDNRLYSLLEIDPTEEHIMGILWYGYRDKEQQGANGRLVASMKESMRYRP